MALQDPGEQMQIEFADIFRQATEPAPGQPGLEPYPYQVRLATDPELPSVLEVPTGAGKTRAVLLAWLYRRFFAGPEVRSATPRRLVYALPMRVLVEQTWEVVNQALDRLAERTASVERHLLLGGQVDRDWEESPEAPAVLVGTIDMLLSRALNRGYAAGRARWPMDFGLLNSDCLWVLDETQLMEVATTTAAQLQALREKLGTWVPARTLWMSATMDRRRLRTVDHPDPGAALVLDLADVDGELGRRLRARKVLRHAGAGVVGTVRALHQPGTLTLAVHNTVAAAAATHRELRRRPVPGDPELVLLHSRFRPPDRRERADRLKAAVPEGGRVVCATQVVEAGVDVSAQLLITEVAPWSSLVQRLGRCNRYGEVAAGEVRWVEVAKPDKPLPYAKAAVDAARDLLTGLEGDDLSPDALGRITPPALPPAPAPVLRRRDLLDLFDTAADLSGNDLDVSRFIREGEEDVDCRVYWRSWEGDEPPTDRARRDELCPAPVGELRKLLKDGRPGWMWDQVKGEWREPRDRELRPGMVVLLRAEAGGYSSELGWDPRSKPPVPPVASPAEPEAQDANRSDPDSQGTWVTLREHTGHVVTHAVALWSGAVGEAAPRRTAEVMRLAALWHDVGKAHPGFQRALMDPLADPARAERAGTVWAKSAHYVRPKERNPRHELASALALLECGRLPGLLEAPWDDLLLFLIAAHHGKARVSIRAWPDDKEGRVLGIAEGDRLPRLELDGLEVPEVALSLEVLRLGNGPCGPSWADRMLRLRDDPALGPFRIAHMEAVLRAADWRASAGERPEEGIDA